MEKLQQMPGHKHLYLWQSRPLMQLHSGVGVERLWNCQSYSSMSMLFVIRGNCHVHWQYEFYIVLPPGFKLLQPLCSISNLYAPICYVIICYLCSPPIFLCVCLLYQWVLVNLRFNPNPGLSVGCPAAVQLEWQSPATASCWLFPLIWREVL